MTVRTRNPGTGRAERDILTARRDAQAAELRATGMQYRQIAEQLGCTVSMAHDGVRRAIAAVPVEAVEQLRAVELDRLDKLTARAFQVLAADHPYVSNGRVFRDLQDAGPVLGAIRELRQISESRRKLLGLDAPARSQVQVITEDVIDAEIARLAAELEARHGASADRGAAGEALPPR